MSGQTSRGVRLPIDVAILKVALPDQPIRPIGVLLLDVATNKLYCKISREIRREDEVLGLWADDLIVRADEVGGEAVLQMLEDRLSNVLQLTERERILVEDPVQALDQVFLDRVVHQAG